MCDWMSWIEKNGKLYFLRDDDIAAKWPNDDVRDHIGHSSIEKFYPEAKNGRHCESATKVPKEIATEINRGKMNAMAKAGGWNGARYSSDGNLNSAWWKKAMAVVHECKKIKWFSNSGEINPEWKIFDTRDAAWAAAGDAARAAARAAAWAAAGDAARAAAGDAARSAAWAAGDAAGDAARAAAWAAAGDAARAAAGDAARDAAWAAAGDAAILARCEIVEFLDDNQFKIHAQKRMDVWRAGYGLLCDVNGVLYVYKRLV